MSATRYFDQHGFDVRCEWGERGVAVLAPLSDAVIVVDVLSFSTSVDVAVGRGAVVFPYGGNPDGAPDYAVSVGALLAGRERSRSQYSLSPESLVGIPAGTRIVLPSPNGATLSLAAHPTPVLAGCLRNARAVALAAQQFGPRIAVIPAGERWPDDRSLRASFEDLVGAGAIISHLGGRQSPEAEVAVAAFEAVRSDLDGRLQSCSSGRELIERGYPEDARLASQLDISTSAPLLVDKAFVKAADPTALLG